MVFRKTYIFVAVFSVLVLIAKKSEGKDQAIDDCVQEFDSQLNNEEYKNMHANAFKTIDDVNEAAKAALGRVSAENEKSAIREMQKGYVKSIKCVAVSGATMYKTNQEVRKSSDDEGSEQKINESLRIAKEIIAAAGLNAYIGDGAGTQMAGNYAKQPIKKAIKKITSAGQTAYSGLDVAEELALLGLGMGSAAKEQSLNASSKAVENAGAGTYANLRESAMIAFGGVDRTRSADSEDLSSGTAAARESSEASSAIEAVKSDAKSTQSQVRGKSAKEAVAVVRDGVIAAIEGLAGAIKKTQQVLRSAQKDGDQECELSKKSIREIIEKAESNVAYGAANAYQGIGMAGQKVGGEKKDQLANAMSSVEAGRAALYNALENAKYLVTVGLDNGQTATKTGINAAYDAVQAGAFVGYRQLENAANVALDILKS